MNTISKILFRLVIVYSVVVGVLVLPIVLGQPWDRGAWEVDSRPRISPLRCDFVQASDAADKAEEVREKLGARSSDKSALDSEQIPDDRRGTPERVARRDGRSG